MIDEYITREFRKYELIPPGSIYEIQVQHIVAKHIPSIFPGYTGKICEPYFATSAGDVKPDIVIIKNDLSSWGVVEVEIDHHSWSAHILPQLTKLSYAKSDDRSNNTILDSFSEEFEREDLLNLLANAPDAYLVTHGSSRDAESHLRELDIQALDIQIHKHPPGDYLLQVKDRRDDYEKTGFIVRRARSPIFRNFWTADASSIDLPRDLQGEIRISLGLSTAIWAFDQSGNSLTFRPPTNLEIPENLETVISYRQRNAWALKWVPEVASNLNKGEIN
jgi:hypothetical protein